MLAGIDRDSNESGLPAHGNGKHDLVIGSSSFNNSPGNRTSLLSSFKASLSFSGKTTSSKSFESSGEGDVATAKRLSSSGRNPPLPPPPPPPSTPPPPVPTMSPHIIQQLSPISSAVPASPARNGRLSRKAPPPPPPDDEPDDLYNLYPTPSNNLPKESAQASKPVRRISHSGGLALAARTAALKKSNALPKDNIKI
jgi:hypothetical protein